MFQQLIRRNNSGIVWVQSVRKFLAVSCLLGAVLAADSARAYLGTFDSNAGYQLSISQPGGSYNWADVSYYNAGAYGVNAGGGPGPTLSPPNSGLWKIIGQPGGFFANSTTRNATVGSAPPYPLNNPGNTVAAYIVGGHFTGHNNDNNNLAIRNDTAVGTGPVKYDYYIDQYDMGTTPSLVTTGIVDTSFYFLPSQKTPNNSGALPPDKFTLSFVDTSGAIGMQWGYAMDNQVTWRTNPSGPWNYTGIIAREQLPSVPNPPNWDGVSIKIDLTADTFQFDYFTASTNSWATVVPAGTPLNLGGLGDLTRLRWQMEDNVSGHFFGKNYFDDFAFKIPGAVPEPSTAALMGLALVATVGLRRKRSG